MPSPALPHRGLADGPALVAVLSGDGIGPEVTRQAVRVLKLVSASRGLRLELVEGLLGGTAIEQVGTPLPATTLELCHAARAVLVGAVGGPAWDHLPAEQNPGLGGLLRLRRELDVFANLRPGVSYLPELMPGRAADVDILLVREAVGGAYFSPTRGRRPGPDGDVGFDTIEYTAGQVERVAEVAFRLARGRSGRLTSVDKANVLESSRLWREVVTEVAARHPDVEVEHLYVDSCAMQLVLRPEAFDVVVTENLFGDILSDEIAGVVGSLGLLPSGSVRDDGRGLYEPVHGSAPDLAGTDRANPTAAILSVAMLMQHSLGLETEAELVRRAVVDTLRAGHRTPDVARPETPPVSTDRFGALVCERLDGLLRTTTNGAPCPP